MTLSNKEVLALLRIGLGEEIDLSVLVLAESKSGTPVKSRELPNQVGEARESNPMVTEPTGPDFRGAQFISPTNRGLFLLATLP